MTDKMPDFIYAAPTWSDAGGVQGGNWAKYPFMNVTKYYHESEVKRLRDSLDCAQWLLKQSKVPEKHLDLLPVIDAALEGK